MGDVIRGNYNDLETLSVVIDNYILLSPEAVNLEHGDREKLQRIMNNDPLALIEYWSVDPDYDGKLFCSQWQDYRGNLDNDDNKYRVTNIARLTNLPLKPGKRSICVRAVDIFGFEAQAIIEA